VPTGTRADPPDNSLRVAYEGTYLGTSWAVIHWFFCSVSAPLVNSDLDSMATALQAAFQDKLVHYFCNDQVHFKETALTLFLPLSQKRRRVKIVDAVGGNADNPLPAQVSILIDWSTLDGRRGGKPRSYLPGVGSDHVDESYSVKASTLANLNTHVAEYITAVNAITTAHLTSMKFVEMSFVSAGAYRAEGAVIYFDIDSGYVRPVLATQRRRVDRQAA